MHEGLSLMRVPVVDINGKALMPSKPGRVQRWIKEGKAIGKWSKLGIFYVQLLIKPSGRNTQDIAVGINTRQAIQRHCSTVKASNFVYCTFGITI